MIEPITVVTLARQTAAAVRRTVPQKGLSAFFAEVLPTIAGAVQAQGAVPAGAPYGRFFQRRSFGARHRGGAPGQRPFQAGRGRVLDDAPRR